VRKSIARAKSRVIGSPLTEGVEHGPQVSEAQLNSVLGWIKKGKAQGAKLACGGKRWGKKGYFVEPTVFTEVTDDMDPTLALNPSL